MTTLDAEVRAAAATLGAVGIASPHADAIELAAFTLVCSTGEVRRRMVMRAPADARFLDRYAALVTERAARLPLQHLTGRAHFRRLTLQVGPGVFVPRPETELVAGLAIAAARDAIAADRTEPVVVDLCTGSGAIALSVKDEVPSARVSAVDLSDLAVAWAARNIEASGLEVHLRLGDAGAAYEELVGLVDVVVSNPPYIPIGQVPVDPEVRDHDPDVALYGGSSDGLAIPLAVARRAAALLRPGGVFVMEHADVQGDALGSALERAGVWRDVLDHIDLNGRPRAIVATRRPGDAIRRPNYSGRP